MLSLLLIIYILGTIYLGRYLRHENFQENVGSEEVRVKAAPSFLASSKRVDKLLLFVIEYTCLIVTELVESGFIQ